MNTDRSTNWIYHVALGFVLLALFGFTYSVKREQVKAAPKASHKRWGTLSNFALGQTLPSARKLVRGADSIRDIELPGRLRQHTLHAKWRKGDHVLTLVFLKGRLVSACETQNIRDGHRRILQRDWQAVSQDQPRLELGGL